MAIGDHYREFTKMDIETYAPEKPGIYGLYDFGESREKSKPREVLHIDGANDLRQALLHHWTIRDVDATRFSFEVCDDPEKRIAELRKDKSLSHALPARVEMHPSD